MPERLEDEILVIYGVDVLYLYLEDGTDNIGSIYCERHRFRHISISGIGSTLGDNDLEPLPRKPSLANKLRAL